MTRTPAPVAWPSRPDLAAGGTLPAAWTAGWRAQPGRVAVLAPDATLTNADLDERTAAVAGRLHRAGVRAGDRVIVSGAASAALVVAHCALLRLGAVVVPVNPAYTAREVGIIVSDATPAAAIVDDPATATGVPLAVSPAVDLPDGPTPPLDGAAPGDPALLPYTSGTTGTPKGALLSHANLLAGTRALLHAWEWTAEDRLILCLPLFHMHGLGVGLHGTLLAGASAVLQPGFDPAAVVDAAGDATMFFGVPTMYARLADTPGVSALGRLRLLVSGSAPLAAALHARIGELTGQAVLERYGMTETIMLTSNPLDGERRPGTVGIPLPGVELSLDERSQILVRGPNVFGGYWRRNERPFTADGWFPTGDIGEFDGAGYLRIVGRAKELIITGGFNVYPREVEDVLREHPSVVDAAVAGTPDDRWGEVVTAYVEATDPWDPDALLAWAADRLVAYKRPRIVHRVAALPRNKLGKILRAELKAPSPD